MELSFILVQDPCIDFQSEGVKIVLYLVSPGGASTVDARGEKVRILVR